MSDNKGLPPTANGASDKGAPKAEDKKKPVTVVATEKGWYDNERKEPGDKFTLGSEADFSKRWMSKI